MKTLITLRDFITKGSRTSSFPGQNHLISDNWDHVLAVGLLENCYSAIMNLSRMKQKSSLLAILRKSLVIFIVLRSGLIRGDRWMWTPDSDKGPDSVE